MPQVGSHLWSFKLVGSTHEDRQDLFQELMGGAQLGVLVLAESSEYNGVEALLTSWGSMQLRPALSLGWLSKRNRFWELGEDDAPHPESDLVQFRTAMQQHNVSPRRDGVYEGLTGLINTYAITPRGVTVSIWVHRHKLYGDVPTLVRA